LSTQCFAQASTRLGTHVCCDGRARRCVGSIV
jgi:hypothetical protein